MERRRLGIPEKVGNLPDRQRRLGEVPAGRRFARIVEQLLIRDAFVCQPSLKRARRHAELAAERFDARVASPNPRRQHALNLQRETGARGQSPEDLVGVLFEDLPQGWVPSAQRQAPGLDWDAETAPGRIRCDRAAKNSCERRSIIERVGEAQRSRENALCLAWLGVRDGIRNYLITAA